jgi:predicted tellurium resistance membrane protein TerC
MDWITDSQIWIALITLTALEIILGIDNIVVISILSSKLPLQQQQKARSIGLGLALITRVLFLLSIVWLASLAIPLFSIFGRDISIRDLILIGGGLFLLTKATHEIHGTLEKEDETIKATLKKVTFFAVITQIVMLDIVFSIDSVITAIGMAQKLGVMIAAIVIAIFIMLIASNVISNFIHQHPSLKILALSFLLMVGVTLIAEGLGFHIPKEYIYFAMAFSGFVETLNIIAGNRRYKRRQIVNVSQE